MIAVSVVIPVKNEEKNIARCLDCLRDFDDVMLVDSGSTDRTCEIANGYENVKVIQFSWNGQFPKKRNWALQNCQFRYDWILFLDGDEFVTPEFVRELVQKTTTTRHKGFWLTFDSYFMGRRLRFGDKFHKIALMRKGCGAYEKTGEKNWSSLDMEVHEPMVIDGSVGRINAAIVHRDYNGLKSYIERHNEYSSWEARQYFSLRNDQQEWNSMLFRRKLKYYLIHSRVFGGLYFVYAYIFKLGFLDGLPGFMLAAMKMSYYIQIYGKIKENRQENSGK